MVRRSKLEGWPVSASGAAFGLSRPSLASRRAPSSRGGLPALWLQRDLDGRGGHKLRDEVLDFIQEALDVDPDLGAAPLTEAVADAGYDLDVHPRFGVTRALGRRHSKKAP